MRYETILYDVNDGVARITINQPESKNRLSNTVLKEIVHAARSADEDAHARVLIISGAGGDAFCAGADLKGIQHDSVLKSNADLDHYAELCLTFHRLRTPSIAMIRGYALAGGCGLAMLPTFSIASEKSRLGTPEINVGMWPMMVMAILFRTVGRKKGLDLICTGAIIDAREAERIGMITKAVPDEHLESSVAELADILKSKSGPVLGLGLEAFQHSGDMEFEKAVAYLKNMAVVLTNTSDSKEGTKAFVEKRKPVWS
ncbi:MAG: enoyl-CoA hydratase/isomerase family protein [Desulfobacteraceae bacterium]|nr:MAG: enoyl-CoA hydratase/isomerase family protein [Desulfobacteraceae bacterium]